MLTLTSRSYLLRFKELVEDFPDYNAIAGHNHRGFVAVPGFTECGFQAQLLESLSGISQFLAYDRSASSGSVAAS